MKYHELYAHKHIVHHTHDMIMYSIIELVLLYLFLAMHVAAVN